MTQLAKADQAQRTRAEFAFESPLKTALDGLRQSLQAAEHHG